VTGVLRHEVEIGLDVDAELRPVGLLVLYAGPDEAARATLYLARLAGFSLIILGIIDKNRRR